MHFTNNNIVQNKALAVMYECSPGGILTWEDFVLGGICPRGFCLVAFCPDTSMTSASLLPNLASLVIVPKACTYPQDYMGKNVIDVP